MKPLNSCLCCSEPLLRHVRHGGVYWFCLRCRQEMPDVLGEIASRMLPNQSPIP